MHFHPQPYLSLPSVPLETKHLRKITDEDFQFQEELCSISICLSKAASLLPPSFKDSFAERRWSFYTIRYSLLIQIWVCTLTYSFRFSVGSAEAGTLTSKKLSRPFKLTGNVAGFLQPPRSSNVQPW